MIESDGRSVDGTTGVFGNVSIVEQEGSVQIKALKMNTTTFFFIEVLNLLKYMCNVTCVIALVPQHPAQDFPA